MTEAELDNLLLKSARRMRFEHGLRAALAALGLGLLAAAGIVLLARLKTYDALLAAGLFVPPVAALIALIAAYTRYRPGLGRVALLLDQRSNSAEHLVTWHEYRTRPERAQSALQREFLDAQRNATLTKAAAIDARKLIPLRWPEWSRAVLLAFLLLCCAWLTPRGGTNAQDRLATEDGRGRRDSARANSAGAGDVAGSTEDEMPTMEQLSLTDQQKFMLLASDEKLAEVRKTDAFRELQSKLAGIPESQLTPLDRQLLNQFRTEAAKADKPRDSGGSDQTAGAEGAYVKDAEGKPIRPAAIPEDPATAFSAIRNKLPAEMQRRLESYYRPLSAGASGK